MTADRSHTVLLNNGVTMPLLGLGMYLMKPGKETYEAVTTALETGYRLIDTASMYGNEKDVGKAVRDSTIPRKENLHHHQALEHGPWLRSGLRAFEKTSAGSGSTTSTST